MTHLALEVIFLGTDTPITLEDLRDINGDLVDSATVTANMFDVNNDLVPGGFFPLTLPFVSTGKYQAILNKAVNLTENAIYELKYTIVNGADDLECWLKLIAKRNFK